MIRPWKEISSREVLKAYVFKYFKKKRQSPDGNKEFEFDVLECHDWVNVLALNEENEFIMVKQFRHGTEKVSVEFPAGLVDSGEDFLGAAKRELLEETGYTSSEWTFLGEMDVNPAFMTNKVQFYLASNCKNTHDQNLDPLEDIEVEHYSIEKVKEMVKSKEIGHLLVSAGLFFFDNK